MGRQMSRHSQLSYSYSVTSPSGGHRIIKLFTQPSAQAYCYITEVRGGGESGKGDRKLSGIFKKGIQSTVCVNTESMTRGGQREAVDYH